MNLTYLAAESNSALAWLFLVIWVLVIKWGWLAGSVCLAAIFPLRGAKNPWLALLLFCALFGGMLLLVVSVAWRLYFWLRA